jgi:hypothetical protein
LCEENWGTDIGSRYTRNEGELIDGDLGLIGRLFLKVDKNNMPQSKPNQNPPERLATA